MKLLKDWEHTGFEGNKNQYEFGATSYQYVYERVLNVFKWWERDNLTVTYGKRHGNDVEMTYGLPYTSSQSCAGIWNTNVEAVLNTNRNYKFQGIVIAEKLEIVAYFTDNDESEKFVVIGKLRK